MDHDKIAKQFLDEYYKCQSSNKAGLMNFYTEQSCLSYNGDHRKGIEQIKEKIESLSYNNLQYKFEDYFIQPGPVPNSIVVFVTGKVAIDTDSTFNFCQCFQLVPNGSGGFYIHNDLLKLVM